MELKDLAEKWLAAKSAEESARDNRIAIETQIADLMPGEDESTVKADADGFKITAVRKFTRSLTEGWESMMGLYPCPIRMKPEVDLKALRAIEAVTPNVFKLCQKYITVKPAKIAIKVEEVEA